MAHLLFLKPFQPQVSTLSTQRTHFSFSTQCIVTHPQARGGEGGAQPAFFISARLKPLEMLSLSLAWFCATQGSACAYKDAFKKYKP